MEKKIPILAVVGPTASGKTALALALAKRLGGEIICADSMQIYRGMDIGTAKPTPSELAAVPHHLVDIADPKDSFSVADYVELAKKSVETVQKNGHLPIFCGGTGLYLDAFLRGGLPDTPAADPMVREELLSLYRANGADYMHEELEKVDPESAAAIHKNNVRRVIRALEIFRVSGTPKSEWDRRSQTLPKDCDATVFMLRFSHRELLYERIDRRVDEMMRMGLLEETQALRAAGVFEHSPTAAAAIGYKELLPYLEGRCSLPEAVAQLKLATRHYAKRQITWFSTKPYVQPIDMVESETPPTLRNFEEIVNICVDKFLTAHNML